MNIFKAYGTFEQKVFNLLPQKEQESWVASPKLARLGIKAIIATGSFMTFVAAPIVAVSPPAPVVAQAPAPIEQVVEAPVVETPAPVVVAEVDEPEFKYGWEESRAQYKWFYNFYRNSGMGHGDARSLAEEQLREQGFDYTVVTNTFARDVRLAY